MSQPSSRWVEQCGQRFPANLWFVSIVSALAITSHGCYSGGIRLVHAEGQVRMDGKPVEGAGVVFAPTAGGPIATATTNESGHFILSTTNRDGAPIGEHRVTIAKTELQTMPPPPGQWLPLYKTKYIIPEKYCDPNESGFVVTVGKRSKDNVFTLELSSE
jgi:hypothetical protein